MATLSLVLSLVALVLALAAILAVRSRVLAAPPPPLVPHTISGDVKVTNDCDGQIGSIPAQVTIETELQNNAGNIAVPGRVTVNLVPDPAAGPNPIKIGTYSITVNWPAGAGNPARWTRPVVRDRPFGTPICRLVSCPGGQSCRDSVQAGNIAFATPTAHDIEVVCACSAP